MAINPADPYTKTLDNPGSFVAEDIALVIANLETNKVLLKYRQEKIMETTIPSPAEAAKRPQEVESNEQLFLKGLHIEQYRHATYVAKDYYEEALRRDANDIRNNNALGLWYMKRGKFAESEPYFRRAVATLSKRNPNPYDGEPFYNLGWSLKLQRKNDEAFDAFYKCTWNDAWQHAGYLNLARIATGRQDYEEALLLIEKSILKNYHSHTARHLKAVLLRKESRKEDALALIEESLKIDQFNYGCLFEKYLWLQQSATSGEAETAAKQLRETSRNWVHNFIEYAFDYAHAGLFREAGNLLLFHINSTKNPYPMLYYYLGSFASRQGDAQQALSYFKQAAALSPDFCFPNRIEDVPVLLEAIALNPEDSKALYYLGNFWYDKRQHPEAIACWEQSIRLDDRFPTVLRNLSLACYNKLNNPQKALALLEKAFALDESDARILMELDQLYKKLNTPHERRLQFLEKHLPLAASRDDLYLERITLYNQLGEYQKAKDLIAVYKFHPWEGGEGKVVNQYLVAHLELAKQSISNDQHEEALQLLNEAENYPLNLGEGKLPGTQENDIHYLKGLAYEGLDEQDKATQYFKSATEGISEPVQAIFYNDPQPDKIFYQGLAWIKLGNTGKADEIFKKLIAFGLAHINDTITIDYFAVSLPDLLVFDADLNLRNKIHCLYLMGLGNLGLGNGAKEEASRLFDEVLSLDINHQGALAHQQMIYSLPIDQHVKSYSLSS